MSSTTPDIKIIKAGAGAGKTTRLVREVTQFYKKYLLSHNRPPRIVLTTFTRKATQEMRERLMREAQKNNDTDYLNYILTSGQLHVSTIHGVLQNFLKHYGYMIDLDPAFHIVGLGENNQAAGRILKQILVFESDFQKLLENFTFKDLVDFCLKYFELNLTQPENQPYTSLDFKNEFHLKLKKLEDDQKNIILKYPNSPITDSISKLNLSYENWVQNFNNIVEFISSLTKPRKAPEEISVFINNLREIDITDTPSNWNTHEKTYEQFDHLGKTFFNKFFEWKLKSGRLYMGDLEPFTLFLMRTRPDALQNFAAQWDYWLIDEFQDTSPVQVRILDHLIKNRPHFIVGDPQQSIYFFRGARKQVFEEQIKKIAMNNGELEVLDINYRSSSELLHFINDFFSPFGFHPMKSNFKTIRSNVAQIFFSDNENAEVVAIINYVKDLIHSGVAAENIAIISRKNSDLKKINQQLIVNKIPTFLNSAQGFNSRREILDALAFLKFLLNPFDNYNLILLLRSPWFYVSDADLIKHLNKNKSLYWSGLLKTTFEPICRLNDYLQLAKKLGITHTFEKGIAESGMLGCSFEYDPTGRRESNLWKLIARLHVAQRRPGFNYIDFINSISKDFKQNETEDDSDAVSAIEPRRVNLMTVHVSKGLEFDHVIVPFMGKATLTTKYLPFVQDENKWGLSKVGLPHLRIIEETRRQELEESDRLLYVATTRAKKSLFLTTSRDFEKNSWFSRIKLNLEISEHHNANYIYRVIDKFEENSHVFKTWDHTKVRKPHLELENWNLIEKHRYVTQNQTFKKTSGTQIVDLNQSAEEGTLTHRLFEILHHRDEKKVIELANKWFEKKSGQFERALSYLRKQDQLPIFDLIKNGHAEWGFVIKENSTNVGGKIDLWGDIDSQLWIVDYKTGNPLHVEKAFEQLNFYSKAIKAMHPERAMNLAVVFPFHQKIFVRKI